MQFTTPKSQRREHRYQLKLERRALMKRMLGTLFHYICAGLVFIAPALALVLGWIKD